MKVKEVIEMLQGLTEEEKELPLMYRNWDYVTEEIVQVCLGNEYYSNELVVELQSGKW